MHPRTKPFPRRWVRSVVDTIGVPVSDRPGLVRTEQGDREHAGVRCLDDGSGECCFCGAELARVAS